MERMSSSEPAVDLWYAGYRSEPITVLEAWEAIGHDIGCNPSKQELLESLRYMSAMCKAHGYDFPDQVQRTASQSGQGGLVEALEHVSVGAEILQSLIDSIESNGNYSQESTVLFLSQALGCIRAALPQGGA